MRRLRRSDRRGERAAVAVEFALLLPILAALVMGIFEFGRGYNIKVELTGAVREGARALALGKTSSDAQAAVTNAAPGISGISFSAVATCPPGSTGTSQIKASFPYSYNVFFFTGSTSISATGRMRCGV